LARQSAPKTQGARSSTFQITAHFNRRTLPAVARVLCHAETCAEIQTPQIFQTDLQVSMEMAQENARRWTMPAMQQTARLQSAKEKAILHLSRMPGQMCGAIH
jgi:hypothetical protein